MKRFRPTLFTFSLILLLTSLSFVPAQADCLFVRGDVNEDGAIDIGDAVGILYYLFLPPSQISNLDSADINDDGMVDIGDAVRLLNYLFAGGIAPYPPFPEPGIDPTEDSLVCTEVVNPPEIINLTPINNSTFYQEDRVLISPTLSEPDPSLEYQFYIDGIIIQPWIDASSYIWGATPGLHNIEVRVRNSAGEASREVEIYVYRRPIPPE